MNKRKFISLFLVLVFTFMLGANKTLAIDVEIDPNNIIALPSSLYSDEDNKFEISETDDYEAYYQVKDISDKKDTVTKINKLLDLQDEYKKLSEKHEAEEDATKKEEYANQMLAKIEEIDAIKSEIKDLLDNYGDDFKKTTDNKIPSSLIKKDKYYIVWIKITSNENDYYDYEVYKALESGNDKDSDSDTKKDDKDESNPDTGIETTALYIGIFTTIAIGSYLIINRNKEKFE